MTYRIAQELQGTLLERIVSAKVRSIQAAKRKWPAESIRMTLEGARSIRSLKSALARRPPSIIAELKRASPSAGILRHDFQPSTIAAEYVRSGAAAISVLTEREFFQGGIEILAGLGWHIKLPLLRKDFIVDPYQIFEARHAGADAVLLIAAILDEKSLRDLLELTEELGMEVLVEVHDGAELDRALSVGAGIIGVNNRDLRTFETSLDVSLELIPHIPDSVIAVAESGIRSGEDIRRLSTAGFQGFLVGESFLRSESPGTTLSHMLDAASRKG